MYNYFMLIGIVYKDVETKKAKNGSTYKKIPLLVSRPFKNPNGEYDADIFHIYLWESLADIASSIKKGDKLGIKGRIQSKFVQLEDKTVIPANSLVAERVVLFDSIKDSSEDILDPDDISIEPVIDTEDGEISPLDSKNEK